MKDRIGVKQFKIQISDTGRMIRVRIRVNFNKIQG